MSREIPLTRGKVAIVDDADFERLSQSQWYAHSIGYTFYARTTTPRPERRTVLMHRELLGAKGVDHINGDGLDNRRCNLRLATGTQNQANKRATLSLNGVPVSSRYKGVSRRKGRRRWNAAIKVQGRRISLGTFRTERDAALAYNGAAVTYFGEFARLNEIPAGWGEDPQ